MLRNNNSSFTLIELLVTLAIVAVLSVVVILALNPAELLKQARDSNRLSDLATINTALNLFSTDVLGGFMGTSTVVYVSLPSTTSTCSNLGLPTLPSGYTYNCVTQQNLRNTDGTGWIPVNFQRISSNSPISQLPIDPQNTTSTKYYTYVAGGSWKVIATPESQKYIITAGTDGGTNIGQFEVGNNMSLAPFVDALVGWWKFDEGSGSVVADSSGYGNAITLIGSPQWVSGRSGGAVEFNGVNQHGYSSTSLPGVSEYTFISWIKTTSTNQQSMISNRSHGGQVFFGTIGDRVYVYQAPCSPIGPTAGNIRNGVFRQVVFVRSPSGASIYVDGQNVSSFASTGCTAQSSTGLYFSYESGRFTGAIDGARVYKRVLSASEIALLYSQSE